MTLEAEAQVSVVSTSSKEGISKGTALAQQVMSIKFALKISDNFLLTSKLIPLVSK